MKPKRQRFIHTTTMITEPMTSTTTKTNAVRSTHDTPPPQQEDESLQRKPKSRQGRRRRRCPPDVITVQVPFDIPTPVRTKLPRPFIALVSIKAMIGHIAYTRGLFPSPLSQILDRSNDNSDQGTILSPGSIGPDSTTRPHKRVHRKTIRCQSQVLEMWSWLDRLLDYSSTTDPFGNDIVACLLSIGNSWERPKETYLLDFNGLDKDDANQRALQERQDRTDDPFVSNGPSTLSSKASVPGNRAAYTVSRRLIGKFMDATNQEDRPHVANYFAKTATASSTSCKLFVSFFIKPEGLERLERKINSSSGSNDTCWQGQSQLILREGSCRWENPVRKPKTLRAHGTIRIGTPTADVDDRLVCSDAICFSLPVSLRGFRL